MKIFFAFLISINYCCLFSQNYEVTYKVDVNENIKFNKENNKKADISAINELYDNARPVTANLIFSDSISIYKVDDVLEIGDKNYFNIIKARAGKDNTYYKVLGSNKSFFTSNRTANKQLVVYSEESFGITNKSKKILGYTCYKAIMKDKSNKHYIAWFAPELPFPYGPRNIHGLPGLVLQYQDGKGFNYMAKTIKVFSGDIKLPEFKNYKEVNYEIYVKNLKKNIPRF